MAPAKKPKKQDNKDKIRIRLKAFDHRALDLSAYKIIETARRTGSTIVGPIPLPTRCERFTVLRSPHVDRKSRDQFEVRTYSRLLELLDPTHNTMDELAKLNIPAGVNVEIKM